MRNLLFLFLILSSLSVSGQIVINGNVKDYHSKETLQGILIYADTIDFYRDKCSLILLDSTHTNSNGYFNLKTNYTQSINLTFSFIGYVSLTIKNIDITEKNQTIELGDIYLPFRGQWIEGYKIPEGETKKEARKRRKEWEKNGGLAPINWAGYSNDFLDSFQGKDNAYIEYPISGSEKYFQRQDIHLIIDYKEFIRK
jgi:hypothetical protein